MKLVVGVLSAAALLAQTPQVIEEKAVHMRSGGFAGTIAGGPPQTMQFIHSEMGFGGRTVKNAPYSAETVSESVQTLADGNRIVNKTSTMYYRDTDGRTRREITMNGVPGLGGSGTSRKMIHIDDPVAGFNYMLDPQSKTVHKNEIRSGRVMSMPKVAAGTASEVVTYSAEAKTVVMNQVMRSGANDPNFRKEDLGKKVMEGVEATGVRITNTIPAGQMGNDRAITTVSEIWTSSELQTTISSKRTDPRFGDSTTKVVNLQRGEPARYLFEIPADYKEQENPKFERRIEHKREEI